MKNLIKYILIILVTTVSTLSYSQDTIFIDPTFLGTSNGTITNPYKGWRDFSWTGYEVFLQKRGTQWIGGTISPVGDNVTMGAYGVGPKPKIICNTEQVTSSVKAINCYQGDGITIKDLDLSALYDISCIISPSADNNPIIIDSCLIHDASWGIRVFNTDADVIVRNCEIYNTGNDGFYSENTKDMYFYNNNIHHVNDEDGGGDCIQIAREQRNLYIYNNILDHSTHGNKFCSIFGSAYVTRDSTPDTVFFHDNVCIGFQNDTFPTSGIYLKKSIGHLNAYNNDFIDCATGIWQDASTSIYNNLFYECTGAITVTSSDTAYIANNIFMNNIIAIEGSYGSYARGYNNIFIAGDKTEQFFQEYSDVVLDYNMYSTEGTNYFSGYSTLLDLQNGAGYDQNSFIGYASFVDSVNGDYHILTTSMLKDQGTSVSYRTVDRDSNLVPQGAGYDIGNYEYVDGYTPPEPVCFEGVIINKNIKPDTNNTGVGSIDVIISGTNHTYTYLWSNLETTQDISNLISDNYTIQISYNGTCDTSLTYTVNNVNTSINFTDSICINYTTEDKTEQGFYSIFVDNDTHTFTLNADTIIYIDPNWSAISSPGRGGSPWDSVGLAYAYSTVNKDIYFTNVKDGYYRLKTLNSRAFYTDRWNIFSINDVVEDSIDIGNNQDLVIIDSIQPDENNKIKLTIAESVLNTSSNVYLNGLVLEYLEPPINVCDTTNILLTAVITPDTNSTGVATIDLTVTGGVSPYTYLWSNEATTEDLTNIVSNPSLSVIVTDDSSCTGSDVFEIPNIIYEAIESKDSISINYTDESYIDTNFYNITTLNDTHTFYMFNDTINYIDTNFLTINYPGRESSLWRSVGRYYAYSGYNKNVYFKNVGAGYYELKILSSRAYYSNKWLIVSINDVVKDSINSGSNDSILTINTIQPDADSTIKITLSESVLNTSSNVYLNGLVLKPYTIQICDTTNILLSTIVSPDTNGLSKGSIDLTVTGGKAPYTYVWSNTETTQDITDLLYGTYSVVVTDDNSCTEGNSWSVSNKIVSTFYIRIKFIMDVTLDSGIKDL